MKNENLLMFADRGGQHRYFKCFVNIWKRTAEINSANSPIKRVNEQTIGQHT